MFNFTKKKIKEQEEIIARLEVRLPQSHWL